MLTKEPQYSEIISHHQEHGPAELGMMLSHTWYEDPKRLGFVLARYKFVSKMLVGKDLVLEVGCGSGFGSHIVSRTVKHIQAIDFDPLFIEEAQRLNNAKYPIGFRVWDIVKNPITNGPTDGIYDAAYSLDVLEHIPKEDEQRFFAHIYKALNKDGVLIIGMPSKSSSHLASSQSKKGHINLKTQEELREVMSSYFKNIFSFGMNDEMIHVGHPDMTHYLFCIGTGKR